MQGETYLSLAFKFYKKAADKECKEALYKLGHFYQHGIEVEKNI
jgi:TPR repeat protein